MSDKMIDAVLGLPTEMGQFYDPVKKIITVPDLPNIAFKPGGLGCLLFEKMREHSEETALIDAPTGNSITYATYLQRSIRTALKMKELGVGKDDIISICSANTLDSSVPWIASFLIGAVTSPLDPSLNLEDTKHFIDLTEPKLIFTSDDTLELITRATEARDAKIVSFGNQESETCIPFSEFVREQNGEIEFEPTYIENLKDTALILYSSGTTGLPKGVCLSHEFMMFHSRASPVKFSFLGFSTLYWISTTFFSLNCITLGTFRIVVPEGYTPEAAWKYLEKYKPTIIFLSPSDIIPFYNARPEEITYAPLGFASGGSLLSNEYNTKLRKLFPNTLLGYGYGQTELNLILNHLDPVSYRKIGSCGRPLPGRSYKIVNVDTGENCGPNERGELRVKTQWCMNGYYKRDTSDAYDEEGYLKTGDVVYFDEDYCFYIVDRIKEIFKYKGWHIVPAKLEFKLYEHPDVQQCAVIGIPHPEVDNHAVGVVQLVKGSKTTVEDLEKYMDERTDDRHKLRGGIRIIDEFPVTNSGKIRRNDLRKLFTK